MIATTAPARPDTERKGGARTVLSLAGVEAHRFLRHPLAWVGVAGSSAMMWFFLWGRAPVLQRDSVYLAGALLPLGGAAFLVTFYATLRERSARETLSTFPRQQNFRLIGIQLGMAGPIVVAVVLKSAGLAYVLAGQPVGQIRWLELVGGLAMVATLTVGGVLVARFLPHVVVGLVVLMGLGLLQLLASPDSGMFSPTSQPPNFEWFAPWMVPSNFNPVEELVGRPAGLHLLYLIILLVVMSGLTTVGGGRIGLVARSAVAAGAVLVAVLFAAGPLRQAAEPEPFRWAEAAANQTCVTSADISYCAFPLYADWIPRWQTVVTAVESRASLSLDTVLQRPSNIGWGDDSDVPTDRTVILTPTEWDRAGALPRHALDLAFGAAESAVGLPTMPSVRPTPPKRSTPSWNRTPTIRDSGHSWRPMVRCP